MDMKAFVREYSEIKRTLKMNSKISDLDNELVNIAVGLLLTRIDSFSVLHANVSKAMQLVATDKLPESEYHQWLIFAWDNPYRFSDCIDFLSNIISNDSIDIYEEIQALFSSDRYIKKPLKAQVRYNSVDTVVIDPLNPEKQPEYFDGQKSPLILDVQIEKIKKLEEDEQLARRLQEEEEILMKDYKQNMKQEQTVCQICYVDLYLGNPCFLDRCGHIFHRECLSEGFKAQISTNSFPLKCPDVQCQKQCLESDIKYILPPQLFKKYQEHTLKAYADLHGDSVSWCPTAQCGYMFFYQTGDQPRFVCEQCKKQYCLNCRCEWHNKMSCAEYKVSTTVSQDDKKFLDFVTGKKFKQCPKCKFWVEKNQGCDHMRCRCKNQFCYKCGGPYMKCQCAIKMQQQHRRRVQAQRLLREQSKKKKQQLAKKRAEEKARKLKEKQEKAEEKKRAKSRKQEKK